MSFTLPTLPYPYSALEPHFDTATMEIHHTKHHQAYVDKLNAALSTQPDLQSKSVESLLSDIQKVPENIRQAVINHGGGHHNHSLFWTSLAPRSLGEVGSPIGKLLEAINTSFGSLDAFKQQFGDAAAAHFGSGWAWLVKKSLPTTHSSQLTITTTPNQNSPLMEGFTPLLGLDVWEHAYYLKYQNRRIDYIQSWWEIVNWDEVSRRFESKIS